MKHTITVLAALALLCSAGVAAAQEKAGAGRWEVGISPGGGTFFTKGSTDAQSSFKNYALGASMTWNANRLFGIEGEVGGGLGVKQDITFNQTPFTGIEAPDTIAYNGNAVYAPAGNDRAFVPYVAGGMGGLTVRPKAVLNDFGLTNTTTFLSENLGGGIKWFSSKHWGLRGDYRFIVVNGRTSADSFFGLNETRYGNRVYGSLLLTY
jgi:hypothetical protein